MKVAGAAGFGVLAGAMLIYPHQAAEAAGDALGLWPRSVAPVLGPFMACMLMITSRVGGGIVPRIILGWLCGSPGGARLMQTVRPRGKTALRCAAFTGTMSPMFLLGTVSGWLQSPEGGRILLVCHLLGALLTGLCLPGKGQADRAAPAPLPLGQALRETALALLAIALCMMLGAVAARMVSCALPNLPQAVSCVLQCALEVTSGARALIQLRPALLLPPLCAAISFGGLSLLMQNAAFWQESGVSPLDLCLLRLVHGLLAGALCSACLLFL